MVEFPDDDKGVPIDTLGSPVVESISELAIAADHKERLQAGAGQAVVNAGAFHPAAGRFRHAKSAFRRMIEQADARGDAGADNGASAIQLPRRIGLVAAEKINDVFRCHGSSICLNAEWSKVFCLMVINKTYGCIKFNLIRRKKTFD